MLQPGMSLDFRFLYDAFVRKANMLIRQGKPVSKSLEMLVNGSQLLATQVGPLFIDIPYKQKNGLYYLTVPYFDEQRVFRGDKGVNILKVRCRDGVEVDFVFYIREGRKHPVFEFKLKPVQAARVEEHLVLRQSRGFFGLRTEISPVLTTPRGRLSTMVNKF